MQWSGLVPVDEIPQLLAGVLMLVMAVGVLALGFNVRVNRALALYLVLAGTREFIGSLDDPARAPFLTVWVFRTIPWLNVAIPFAAVLLAIRYRERQAGRPVPRVALAALLAVAVAAEAAYFAFAPVDAGSYGVYLADPFIVFYAGLPPLLAWLGADFARRARRAADLAQKQGYILAATAFSFHAAFVVAVAFHYFYRIAGPKPLMLLLSLSALVPVGMTVATLRGFSRDGSAVGATAARGSFALMGIAVVGLTHAAYDLALGAPAWIFRFADGTLRMALPAMLLYAILRHRLFDIDVRLRWTISRGTLSAVFVGVFFIVAELAQTFFSEAYGWAAGGIAAGLLLFAVSPLQRAAERVAHAAMPGAKPVAAMPPAEREEFYRALVRDAWADGALDRSERKLLDGFRARLGLSHEDAARIELEIAATDA